MDLNWCNKYRGNSETSGFCLTVTSDPAFGSSLKWVAYLIFHDFRNGAHYEYAIITDRRKLSWKKIASSFNYAGKPQSQSQGFSINALMDCVGCEKCLLWGKLQVLGLGTALKILFSLNGHKGDNLQLQGMKLLLWWTCSIDSHNLLRWSMRWGLWWKVLGVYRFLLQRIKFD